MDVSCGSYSRQHFCPQALGKRPWSSCHASRLGTTSRLAKVSLSCAAAGAAAAVSSDHPQQGTLSAVCMPILSRSGVRPQPLLLRHSLYQQGEVCEYWPVHLVLASKGSAGYQHPHRKSSTSALGCLVVVTAVPAANCYVVVLKSNISMACSSCNCR